MTLIILYLVYTQVSTVVSKYSDQKFDRSFLYWTASCARDGSPKVCFLFAFQTPCARLVSIMRCLLRVNISGTVLAVLKHDGGGWFVPEVGTATRLYRDADLKRCGKLLRKRRLLIETGSWLGKLYLLVDPPIPA